MENTKVFFAKGDVIFHKDEVQIYFYEIVSGSVYIFSDYGMPSQKLLAEMKPGETFGEMGVLDYRKRSATAVAASDVETIKIDDEGLKSYFTQDPERLIRIMKQLSERTIKLTDDYQEALHTVAQIRGKKKKDENLISRIARFARIGREAGRSASGK